MANKAQNIEYLKASDDFKLQLIHTHQWYVNKLQKEELPCIFKNIDILLNEMRFYYSKNFVNFYYSRVIAGLLKKLIMKARAGIKIILSKGFAYFKMILHFSRYRK